MAKYINPYTDFGFKKLFGEEDITAELASLTTEQRAIYEENLIQYWGMKSAIETAVEEAVEAAVEVAMASKQVEIAKNLITLGSDNAFIEQATGLLSEEIEKLRTETKK